MLSIIIPTLNEGATLDYFLTELKVNTSSNFFFEIIIADGHSHDDTQAIAQRHGAKLVLSTPSRAIQMNAGAKKSEGDMLFFLHADSLPPKNFDQLIRESGAKTGCFQLQFDQRHPLLDFSAWFTRFQGGLFRGGDQSLFVERELFERIGGFDESHRIMEDIEIIQRLKTQTSFRILPQKVVTSARKYERNGYFRLQFLFGCIHLLYRLGSSQQQLVDFYRRHIDKTENFTEDVN